MTTSQRPPIFSENPERASQRTNPEIHSERDALNMVRNRRPQKSAFSSATTTGFRMTMPLKIGVVTLLFSACVIGFWILNPKNLAPNHVDLPVLSANQEVIDFKTSPSATDDVQIPHSDKEFYSELDASKAVIKNDTFRETPERPESQISQEALFVDGNALPGIQDLTKNTTPIGNTSPITQKTDAILPKSLYADEALTPVDVPLDNEEEHSQTQPQLPTDPLNQEPEPTTPDENDVDIRVVENASDSPTQAYTAPAMSTAVSKPRKTLEMAIHETQRAVAQQARVFEKQPDLAKKDVRVDLSADGISTRELKIISQKNKDKEKDVGHFQPVEATQETLTPQENNMEKDEASTIEIDKSQPKKEVKPTAAAAEKSPTPAKGGGTYWLQLASLPSEKSAQEEGRRLQAKAGKELSSSRFKTVRVDLGKPRGIRHRVNFGPLTRTEAVQKCQTLKDKQKMTCLVVKG